MRTGDSIAEIARLIYPDKPLMRSKLLRTIIAVNPDIFPDGRQTQAAPGGVILIPDLHTLDSIVSASTAATIPTTERQSFRGTDSIADYSIKASAAQRSAVLPAPQVQMTLGESDPGYRLTNLNPASIENLSMAERNLLCGKLSLLETEASWHSHSDAQAPDRSTGSPGW